MLAYEMNDTSRPSETSLLPEMTRLPPMNHMTSVPQVTRNVITDGNTAEGTAAFLSSLNHSSQ